MNTYLLSSFNENAFLTSQHIIQAICDTLTIGIQVLKPVRNTSNIITDFEYTLVNEVYLKTTGNEDPTGKTLLAVHPDQTDVFNRLVKTMDTEVQARVIHSFSNNGTIRWAQDSYVQFQGGVLIFSRDITEQLKAEEQINDLNLALAFKNRQLETLNSELQTFTNIAANDYKETLRNLYTGLEYIASHEAGNLTDTGKANVRRAQASIQKMKLLTEDIITYSTIPRVDGNFSEVDMNQILGGVKYDLNGKIGEDNIRIDCDNLPHIHGYPVLLSLLFHNLIDNSQKFRKDNTNLTIHIRCTEEESRNIRHAAAQPGTRYWVFSVTDNGNGFDPSHAQDIFTIFYRISEKVRYKGSGIGLAICKKIMDLHGGFILAESTPGNGATFYCYFPFEKV